MDKKIAELEKEKEEAVKLKDKEWTEKLNAKVVYIHELFWVYFRVVVLALVRSKERKR